MTCDVCKSERNWRTFRVVLKDGEKDVCNECIKVIDKMVSDIPLQKRGYDDAAMGALNPSMTKEPSYLLGYREYLIKRMEWAREDLEEFDKNHINSDDSK